MIPIPRLNSLFDMCDIEARLSPDSETKVGCIWLPYENSWCLPYFSAHNSHVNGAGSNLSLPTTRVSNKYEFMIHAEQNLLARMAGSRKEMTDGVVIVTLSPCITCCRLLYQAGVRIIYFRDEYREFQSQLNAPDLCLNLTKIGKYTRIELEVRK